MTDIQAQIEAIEEEIRKTPHHKGTNRFLGLMRARIARLKDKQVEGAQKKGGGGGQGYGVKKQGDATIVLVGPPSVGKSTLINALTNAQSKVAPYAFTTVSVIPGMMRYRNANIQILDVPGLIEGAEAGKGRGREVISVIRGCDLLVIITDINKMSAFSRIADSLERNGIRINKRPPDMTIEKKIDGGVLVQSNIKQEISVEEIKDVANEFGFKNGIIKIRQKINFEDLIDAFSHNRVYIPGIFVLNKTDQEFDRNSPDFINHKPVCISAELGLGFEDFKETMWDSLGFLRLYLVKPFEDPHFNSPIIVQKGSTLGEVARQIGNNFAEGIISAQLWNVGAKFPGQTVSLQTKAEEGMQIRFV